MPRSWASQALQRSNNSKLLLAVGSMSHLGGTLLHRTATAVGHATTGKCIGQGVRLVAAARPSAGRSPAAARNAKCRAPGKCRTRMGSGTLPLVKHEANWQSNTKVSRPSRANARLGHERKGGSSNAAPNPSIEGMPKRLRLLCTPHVKR
jgi:hypothetical protein